MFPRSYIVLHESQQKQSGLEQFIDGKGLKALPPTPFKLANTSTAPVLLSAPSLGINAQTNSAYLKIQLLRAGAK